MEEAEEVIEVLADLFKKTAKMGQDLLETIADVTFDITDD